METCLLSGWHSSLFCIAFLSRLNETNVYIIISPHGMPYEQMLTLSLVRFLILIAFALEGANARKWRDTGGTIILEEAWTPLDLLFQVG